MRPPRRGGQRWIPLQCLPLIVMGQQQEHSPVDDGDDGCMPGEQQPSSQMRDTVIGQGRVCLGGPQQVRDDVITRNPAFALNQRAQVTPQRLQAHGRRRVC